MGEGGQKLKRVRERLGLTYRDVEEYSLRIAEVRGSDEFAIALSRLADIENKGTVPSFHRLYTLCAVYRLEMQEVLTWFGIPMANLPADSALFSLPKTHHVGFQPEDGEILAPLAFDPGLDLSKTQFLSRFIQRWGKLPLMLLNHFDLRQLTYGFIGAEDWSMFPILPPGSLVVVDQTRRKVVAASWASEFERPIYLCEQRDGYLCGWCTLKDGTLIVQFHPASGREPETFRHPSEVEVIGQITFVALTLDPSLRRRPRP